MKKSLLMIIILFMVQAGMTKSKVKNKKINQQKYATNAILINNIELFLNYNYFTDKDVKQLNSILTLNKNQIKIKNKGKVKNEKN